MTTHHLDEPSRQCDRIVIIDHGKVIADGDLQELIASTTGAERNVYLAVSGSMTSSIPNLEWDSNSGKYVSHMDDVVDELPRLLETYFECGGLVTDIEMHQPNLHDVFIQLTGRELRE